MNKIKFVNVSEVFEEIFLEESLKNAFHKDSRLRLYRKKFSVLLQFFCCANENYKNNRNDYEIFEQDSYVVKSLIKESVQKGTLTSKWFNGHINKFTNEEIVDLYKKIKQELDYLVKENKVDKVRNREWLGAIDTIFDYSSVKRIIEIEKLLEVLKTNTLPLTNQIAVGELSFTDDTGFSETILEPNTSTTTRYNKSHFLNDVIKQLEEFNEESLEKSKVLVEELTGDKILFGATGTSEDYLDENSKEIASTYVLRDYNIQRFLSKHYLAKSEIEKKLKIDNILDYYQFGPLKE